MLSICTITYNAKCLHIISSKAICEELLTNFTYDRLGLRKKIEGDDKIDTQIAYPSPFLFCFFSRGYRSGKQKTKAGLTSPFTAVTCFFSSFFFCRRHTDFEVRQDKRWSPWGDALLQRWARIQKRNLFTWGWLRLPGSRQGFKSRVKCLLTPIRLISCREHLVDRSLWKNASSFYLRNSVAAKSQITL